MQSNRRRFLAGAIAASAPASLDAAAPARPSLKELDRVAALPVLRTEGLKQPVVIESMRMLKKGKEYMVHVRSKDGAEGVSFSNGRPYLFPIFKELVAPFFIGKDARDLENLLWELYRWQSNYKMYGLAFWSAQAWAEFAILDMLGRVANKPMGAMIGDVVRHEVPFYVASDRRDTTPEQEIDYLRGLLEKSRARAIKFRLGGRMSRNADAMPGRTDKLIPLARKTFGDAIDIHGDANSSYDPPEAIRVGRLLEEIKAVYFEEPCPFDHLEDTKVVTDTLTIPVSGGEQEYSDWRFRWMIANHAVDIAQPDLHYYGGMIRSVRVARMAHAAKMPTTVHISGGFGFVYMLHFTSAIADCGRYQEYKLGTEKYGSWFDPAITVKDGKMSVPSGPGVGIADLKGLLKGAEEV